MRFPLKKNCTGEIGRKIMVYHISQTQLEIWLVNLAMFVRMLVTIYYKMTVILKI